MNVIHRHDWNLPVSEAIVLQKKLATEVVYDRPLNWERLHFVAGVDVSVKNKEGVEISQAAVVVMRYPSLEIVETVLASQPTSFPYIPGLLAFREGSVLEEAFRKLKNEPDAFIFDGMGRAHPRRMGIATHLGLWLQKPTIGCGKTLLAGRYMEPAEERGASAILMDRNETIGVILRTRPRVKPVFISPGHLIDLDSSVELIMRCTTKYRLPEPIRAAHKAAGCF